jgi:hypothetical protein
LKTHKRKDYASSWPSALRRRRPTRKLGWVKDKANLSKKAKLPHIIARVAELQAEEAERQASIRLQAAELPCIDELKKALQGAAAAGQ